MTKMATKSLGDKKSRNEFLLVSEHLSHYEKLLPRMSSDE